MQRQPRIISSMAWSLLLLLLPFMQPVNAARNSECSVPVFLRNNGGLINSHRYFGIQHYPNNLDCSFFIQAPPKYRIVVQFNFLHIEPDQVCNFDYIELSPLYGSYNKNSTRVCGDNAAERFISKANNLRVHFHSDRNNQLEGFQLRFWFEMGDPALIQMNRLSTPCKSNEKKCRYGDDCYLKDWVCDNVRDCRDNSDEEACPASTTTNCVVGQLPCARGKVMCVSASLWCDGRRDCEDNSDEAQCNNNQKSENVRNETKEVNQCSNQLIQPKNVSFNLEKDNPQIVGGEEAVPGSWPWMASLRYAGKHFCGASLIHRYYAITAAHCIDFDHDISAWNLTLGSHFEHSNNSLQNLAIKRIVPHPNFDFWTLTNDAALLELEEPGAAFNNRIQPVCLPKTSDIRSSDKCIILGWGYTANTGADAVLKQAIVPLQNQSSCKASYGDTIDNTMLCAGYDKGGTDSCQGDSGGPLLCWYNNRFKLLGITSWGEGCALPKKPGVYTNVAHLTEWIYRTINLTHNNTLLLEL